MWGISIHKYIKIDSSKMRSIYNIRNRKKNSVSNIITLYFENHFHIDLMIPDSSSITINDYGRRFSFPLARWVGNA